MNPLYREIPGQQYDPVWWAESKGRLGCSKIAAALGFSRWSSPQRVKQEILDPGSITPPTPRSRARMDKGLDMEPEMRRRVDEIHLMPGQVGREANMFISTLHPKLKYSPDYVAVNAQGEIEMIFEFKFRQRKPYSMPIEHRFQMQFAMYIIGVSNCGYLVGYPDESGENCFEYQILTYDPMFIAQHLPSLEKFLSDLTRTED